ncbi:hypothetical protein DPV78_008154 [Talaromyces pinophilus]|nr:hypothetical protein DPV78_008154 [Talaromyces pinophilus]
MKQVFKGNDDLFIQSTGREDPNNDSAISKVANIKHLHADAKPRKHTLNRAAAQTPVAYQALHMSCAGMGFRQGGFTFFTDSIELIVAKP